VLQNTSGLTLGRSLGGISLRLAWGSTAAFTGAIALPDGGRAMRLHGHRGEIERQEGPAGLSLLRVSERGHRLLLAHQTNMNVLVLGETILNREIRNALIADKAYDADTIRDDLKKRGIRSVMPPKSSRIKTIRYSKCLYRQRNCIECMFGHLKIDRAIATRHDQLSESFLAMLFLALARYWLKFVHAA
jgi:transposase